MTTMMTTKAKESSCDDEDESAPDLNAPLTLRLLLLLLPPLLVFLRSPDHALMLLFCDDNGNTSHKLQRQMLIMWRGNDAPNPNLCDYCFHFCLGNWYWESECGLKIKFFLKIVWMWQRWRFSLHNSTLGLQVDDISTKKMKTHKWPSGWWCVTAMSQTAVPA